MQSRASVARFLGIQQRSIAISGPRRGPNSRHARPSCQEKARPTISACKGSRLVVSQIERRCRNDLVARNSAKKTCRTPPAYQIQPIIAPLPARGANAPVISVGFKPVLEAGAGVCGAAHRRKS